MILKILINVFLQLYIFFFSFKKTPRLLLAKSFFILYETISGAGVESLGQCILVVCKHHRHQAHADQTRH